VAHRTCVIIWVRFWVRGTWVAGGADDKEDMLSESDKSSGLYNCIGVTGHGVAGVDQFH